MDWTLPYPPPADASGSPVTYWHAALAGAPAQCRDASDQQLLTGAADPAGSAGL